MIFKTERDLQQRIAELDFYFFASSPISFTRREVRVGGCIPDLVSIRFEKDPNLHTWPKRWSLRHSFALWLLRKQPLTLNEIAASFFEPINKVKPIIDNLISAEIAIENKNNKIALAEHIRKDFKANIIAVEAKLKRWNQALDQAIRYKNFANIVLVAMDASMVPYAEADLEQFRTEMIGLCAVSEDSLDWIVFPGYLQHENNHEKENLIMSATIPSTQRLWSRRNDFIESSQA